MASNKDGRLALVATAGDNGDRDAIWHVRELDSTAWSLLREPPGGPPTSAFHGAARPAITANADGRFEVAAIGTDGAVWHARQTVSNGDWSDWKSLETPPGEGAVDAPPALARNKDGRLELFMVDRASAVWRRRQEVGGDRWSAWYSLQKPVRT